MRYPSALVELVSRANSRLFGSASPTQQLQVSTSPSPYYAADPQLGYRANPGTYVITMQRLDGAPDARSRFKTLVTINDDGTRWTGATPANAKRQLYVFGDSFVFGNGVNDEQTFSAIIQNALDDFEVRLFALGGYSLTQAYLRIISLKEQIGPEDVVLLGYADFHDERHVVAPSRLRFIREWEKRQGRTPQQFQLPRASVGITGELEVDHIQQDCELNNDYCESKDPSKNQMTEVTATLINAIARHTPADTYLLHFHGDATNPVFEHLKPQTTVISSLATDFDYHIRDNVEGFDDHPGPYWHYAISRRILHELCTNKTIKQRHDCNKSTQLLTR